MSRFMTRCLQPIVLILLLVPITNCVFAGPMLERLSEISAPATASLYGTILRKDVKTVVAELRDTSTIIVFRGYYKYGLTEGGLSAYPMLREAILRIKAELPYIHLMGGISAAGFMEGDTWPNGTSVSSQEEKDIAYVLPNGSFARYASDPKHSLVFDIRKQTARDFLVEWAKLQVDVGFDSIFFDEIDYIPLVYGIDARSFYLNWKDIGQRLRNYAETKYGIKLLLGVNGGWVHDPSREKLVDPWPYQDFISVSFSLKTIQTGTILDDRNWYRQQTLRVYASTPSMFAFLDWGPIPSPLSALADLPSSDQEKMLEKLQKSALDNGMIFVYPLHGGNIASGREYDAVEQGTHEKIMQLAGGLVKIVAVTGTVTATGTVTLTVTAASPMVTVSSSGSQKFSERAWLLYLIIGVASGLVVAVALTRLKKARKLFGQQAQKPRATLSLH